MNDHRTQKVLFLVAVLLTLNLVVTVASWLTNPPIAEARTPTPRTTPEKNWFTTFSQDGQTVYLWHHWENSNFGALGLPAEGIGYIGSIRRGLNFKSLQEEHLDLLINP